jgi:hypothetical protein
MVELQISARHAWEEQMVGQLFKRISWTIVLVSCVPGAWLNARQPDDPLGARWHGSYEQAMEQARLERKLMLVHFYDPEEPHDNDLLVIDYFNTQKWAEYGQRLVKVRVPVWWEASIAGQHQQLMQHAAFAELRGQGGLVVIDLTDPESGNYGHVVSVLPLAGGRGITARQLDVLLDLPMKNSRRAAAVSCRNCWRRRRKATAGTRRRSADKAITTGTSDSIPSMASCPTDWSSKRFVRRAGPARGCWMRRSNASAVGGIHRATGMRSAARTSSTATT